MNPEHGHGDRQRRFAVTVLAAVCIVVVCAGLWFFSRLALLYVLTEGLLAAIIVAVATLFGMSLVPAPREPQQSCWCRHILLGAGVGLGCLSLLMLLLGCLGLLARSICIALLMVMGVVGLVTAAWRLKRLQETEPAATETSRRPFEPVAWLIVVLMPFLALALLAATVPPGLIWAEEAHGYDVLEYHLQVPKEYFHDGRITYLPHNIYSNFPMNAEMLFLLAMVLHGDPVQAAILAKMLNLLLGVLFVLAAWLAGRQYDPLGGLLCALIAGSMPWMMYLAGMAYVENGMLFYGMLAVVCLCRFEHHMRQGRQQTAWVLAGGLFAGLACGFKYTALAFICGPLLIVLMFSALRRRTWAAGGMCLLFVLGSSITFVPWMIKNAVFTGNPVFPLAYGIFGARDGIWTDALADRWARGHEVQDSDRPLVQRLSRFKERVLTDKRFGLIHTYKDWRWLILPLPLALILPILLTRNRTDWDVLLLVFFAVQVLVWLSMTHLFARFAVVMIIPLCILMARAALASRARAYRLSLTVAVLLAVGLNLVNAWDIYARHLIQDGQAVQVYGRMELFYGQPQDEDTPLAYVTHRLGAHDRVLMVGDARAFYFPPMIDYCVVFNRNPFAEAVGRAGDNPEIIRWLNAQGYHYLLVHWWEMDRLRRSYGFWPELNDDLFARLAESDLAVARLFSDQQGAVYATLYEIRKRESSP